LHKKLLCPQLVAQNGTKPLPKAGEAFAGKYARSGPISGGTAGRFARGGRDVNGALWICRHSGPTLSKYFYVLYQLINYLLHRSTTSKENFSHFEMRNIVGPAKTVTQK